MLNRSRHFLIVVLTSTLFFFSSPSYAWGPKGHQIVALIAEAHLAASTRDKIKAILPKNDTLAKASIWPDEIRKALPEMNPLRLARGLKANLALETLRSLTQVRKVTAVRREFVVKAVKMGHRPSAVAAFLHCTPSAVSKIVVRSL